MNRSAAFCAMILTVAAAGVVLARYRLMHPALEHGRAIEREAALARWTIPNARVLPPDEGRGDSPGLRELETSDPLDAIWTFYSHQAMIEGSPGQSAIPTARPLMGTFVTHGANGTRSVIVCRQNKFWSADFVFETRREEIAATVSQSAHGEKTHILLQVALARRS